MIAKTKSSGKDSLIAQIGVLLIFVAFPLVVTDYYYNITVTKALFFGVVVSLLGILCTTVYLFARKKQKPVSRTKYEKMLDTELLVLCIFGLITFLLSEHKAEAFTGSDGRYMGFAMTLAFAFCYLMMSFYRAKERDFIALLGAMSVVVLLGLLQSMHLDPFGFMATVPQNKFGAYVSTIGNIDVLSSYISLTLPASLFLVTQKPKSPVYYVFSVFGFFGLFLSNSDSGYIALGVALWVIALLSMKNKSSFRAFFVVLTVAFGSAFLYGICKRSGIISWRYDGITKIVTGFVVSLVGLSGSSLLFILLGFVDVKENTLKKIRRAFVYISLIFVIVLVSAFVYFSAINTTSELRIFENYLRFSEKWGSERGHVWKLCLSAFAEAPIKIKLFGCGQDSLYLFLSQTKMTQMQASGFLTDNAHNELIQYLLTTGIFGLLSYLAFVGTAIRSIIKKSRNNMLLGCVLVCVLAYFSQSLFNILQPITTPLFFLLLSSARSKERNI